MHPNGGFGLAEEEEALGISIASYRCERDPFDLMHLGVYVCVCAACLPAFL
jgi:hypothetical protein